MKKYSIVKSNGIFSIKKVKSPAKQKACYVLHLAYFDSDVHFDDRVRIRIAMEKCYGNGTWLATAVEWKCKNLNDANRRLTWATLLS